MLSEKTVRIVKGITSLVAANAEMITRRFYERMFEPNPEVNASFNQAHQHYSLSDRFGESHFRISVKHEEQPISDAPECLISSHLHDAIEEGHRVQFGPPCGEYMINTDNGDDRPVVLLAGRIGVTPLLSMAKSIVHANPNSPGYFLQAVRNSGAYAFADGIQRLASLRFNIYVKVLYDAPLDVDGARVRYEFFGPKEVLHPV